MKRLFLITISLLLSSNVMAIEEPKYKVIKEYDEFEIREYDSYLVAETEVEETFDEAGNKAFKLLFDYISGENTSQQKIEMTIPVNQSNAGQKIEMTRPVSMKPKLNSGGNYVISFVMPSRFTLDNIPTPKDERVVIREIQTKVVAVRKYSGTWSEDNYRENEKILLEEIEKADLEIIGYPIFSRYNPPFWPWFLRRNEVIVELRI